MTTRKDYEKLLWRIFVRTYNTRQYFQARKSETFVSVMYRVWHEYVRSYGQYCYCNQSRENDTLSSIGCFWLFSTDDLVDWFRAVFQQYVPKIFLIRSYMFLKCACLHVYISQKYLLLHFFNTEKNALVTDVLALTRASCSSRIASLRWPSRASVSCVKPITWHHALVFLCIILNIEYLLVHGFLE